MKISGLLLIFVLLLSSCSPAPAPTATPDLPKTIQALSATSVAATMAAMPSSTQVPTNTPTSAPTNPPTETTVQLTSTPSPTLFEIIPTVTPWLGTLSPGNTEGLPTGLLRIENNTGEKEITITLTGVTLTREQLVYLAYKVTGSLNITVFLARYKYVIQIPGKGMYQGTFAQKSKDKTTIRVFDSKILIVGP